MCEFSQEKNSKKQFLVARLVWRWSKKSGAEGPASSAPPDPSEFYGTEPLEAAAKKREAAARTALDARPAPEPTPEENAAKKKRDEEVMGVRSETTEGLAKMREKINEGDAEKYTESFLSSPKFDYVAKHLEVVIFNSRKEDAPIEDFTAWVIWSKKDPEGLAEFLKNVMPEGTGRTEFIRGITAPDDSPAKEKSTEVLREIIAKLKEHYDEKKEAREHLTDEEANSTFSKWVTSPLGSIKDVWDRGSKESRIAIIVATIAASALAIKNWNKRAPFTGPLTKDGKGFSWGGIGLFTAAVIAANEVAGYANYANGNRRPSDYLGFGRKIDDRDDSDPIKNFILSLKDVRPDEKAENDQVARKENIRFIETVDNIAGKDMRLLFELYREGSKVDSRTKEWIDPRRLGFYNKEIDGKLAYEAVEGVVLQAAVNQYALKHKVNDKAALLKEFAKQPGQINAQILFEEYIDGFDDPPTFFDIAIYANGFRHTEERARRSHAAQEKKTTPLGTVADLAKRGISATGEAAKTAAAATVEHVWEPTSEFAQAGWNRFKRPVKDKLGEAAAKTTDFGYERALPKTFRVEFTSPNEGRINDFPVKLQNRGPRGKAGIIMGATTTITNKQFELDFSNDRDSAINTASAANIEKHIEQEMKALVAKKAAEFPGLASKTPIWDTNEKIWIVKGVPVQNDASLGLSTGSIDVRVRPTDDGQDLEVSYKTEKVKSPSALAEAYRDEVIVRHVQRMLPPIAQGLEVKIASVTPDPTLKARIQGEIAGVPFVGKPAKGGLDTGVEFVGGASAIKIDDTNGRNFAIEIVRNISEQKEFRDLFARANQLIQDTKEIDAKWELAKSFNIDAINGPILDAWWKNMIEFKSMEALRLVERDILDGTNLADIKKIYNERMGNIHDPRTLLGQMQQLVSGIEKLTPEQRGAQFHQLLTANAPFKGLELMNYASPEYQKEYLDLRKMLDGYTYEGFEKIEMLAGDAYKVRQIVLRVWSESTAQLANKAKLDAADITFLSTVRAKIKQHLDNAVVGGTVQSEKLPKFDPEKPGLSATKWIS
ncbi:hypothetical protein COV82_02905 [Candidatus Peregrinibacteria bacterium CG11_big_fil_rev_8_21_14_0_20_46_8]|nr:MAG: hypothetical protein COV82_02905 [Candidatus Peregrinibacteria bacterium CG11_big_fil_rev_8_21_14_0_20_46_8]